jgi:hypothetical protein
MSEETNQTHDEKDEERASVHKISDRAFIAGIGFREYIVLVLQPGAWVTVHDAKEPDISASFDDDGAVLNAVGDGARTVRIAQDWAVLRRELVGAFKSANL